MPTSRRTATICLGSSVSSMPSTTMRPRCQSSSRLMQRSSVDLPPPDGPQMTMRSPRATVKIDVAQHMKIAVPFMQADDLDGQFGRRRRRFGASSGRFSIAIFQRRSRAGEPRLDVAGVARHAVAADEVEQRGKCIAGDAGDRRRPMRIGARRFDGAQKIENADDEDERRILEQPDERIDDIRQRHPQRLRQDDKRHHAPIAAARAPAPPRIGRAASRQARRARPPPYRPRRTARRRSARARSLSGDKRSGTNSGSMTLAMNNTVISGTPRTNSMKVTSRKI